MIFIIDEGALRMKKLMRLVALICLISTIFIGCGGEIKDPMELQEAVREKESLKEQEEEEDKEAAENKDAAENKETEKGKEDNEEQIVKSADEEMNTKDPFKYSYLEEIEKDERFIRKITLPTAFKFQDFGGCSYVPRGERLVNRNNIVWFLDINHENKTINRLAFGENQKGSSTTYQLKKEDVVFDVKTASYDTFFYLTSGDYYKIKRFNFYEDEDKEIECNSIMPKQFLFDTFEGAVFHGIDSETSMNVIFFEESFYNKPYPPIIYLGNSYKFINAFMTADKDKIASFCLDEERSHLIYQMHSLDGTLVYSANYFFDKEVSITAINIKNINQYYVFFNKNGHSYVEEITNNQLSNRPTKIVEENKKITDVIYKNNLYTIKFEDNDNYYINVYNRDLEKLNTYLIKKSDNVSLGDIRLISYKEQLDTIGYILTEDNISYFIQSKLLNAKECYMYNSDDFFNIFTNDRYIKLRNIRQNFYGEVDYMVNPVNGDVYLTEGIYSTIRYVGNIDFKDYNDEYEATKIYKYPGDYYEIYNDNRLILKDQIIGDKEIIDAYSRLKDNYEISNIYYTDNDSLYFVDQNSLYSFKLDNGVEKIYELDKQILQTNNIQLFVKGDYVTFFNDEDVYLYSIEDRVLDEINVYPKIVNDKTLVINDGELVFEQRSNQNHEHRTDEKYYLDMKEKAFVNYRAKDIDYTNQHGFFIDNKFYPYDEEEQDDDFFLIETYKKEQRYAKFRTENKTFIAGNALSTNDKLYLTDYKTGNLYQKVDNDFIKLNNENIRSFDIDDNLLAYSGFYNNYALYLSDIGCTTKKKIYDQEVENIIIDDQFIYFLNMRNQGLYRYNMETDSVMKITEDDQIYKFQINKEYIVFYNGDTIKICDKQTLQVIGELHEVCGEFICNDDILIYHTNGFAIAKYTFNTSKISFNSFAGPSCWFEGIDNNILYYTENVEAYWARLKTINIEQDDTNYESDDYVIVKPITDDIILLCYDPFINYFEPFGHNPYNYSILDKINNKFVQLALYSYEGVYFLNDKLYYWVSNDNNYEERILYSYNIVTGEVVKEKDFNKDEAKCIIDDTPDIQP